MAYNYQEAIERYMKDTINNKQKGDRFLEWILKYMFERTDSQFEDDDLFDGVTVCDGANDGGIDAAYVENGIMYVIQAKYNTSNSYQDAVAFSRDLKSIFLKGPSSTNKASIFTIYNAINKVDQIKAYYITNAEFTDGEYERIKKIQSEEEQEVSTILREVGFEIHYLDIQGIEEFICDSLNQVPQRAIGKWEKLILERYFLSKNQETYAAEVALKSLARFIDKSKDYIFYSNIRNHLGSNNKVNKQIEQTYVRHPKDFWDYNNGITIVCTDFDKLNEFKDGSIEIKIQTPQIVNGCQTCSSIYKKWQGQTNEERERNDGTILVKIIKDSNSKKRTNITKYTNNQSAVTGKDFFALDNFHKQLKKDIFELGYVYEIQRKEQNVKRPKMNKNYKYMFGGKDKNLKLLAKEVAQSFTAGIHLKPGKAKNADQLVPGGAYYSTLFNEINTPTDPRFYVLPYTITFYAKEVLEYKKDNKFKSAVFLYTTIYFRLLMNLLKEADVIDQKANNYIECENNVIKYVDALIINQKLNEELLKKADETLRFLFKDSTIRDIIGDNLPNFFKTIVDNNEKVVSIIINNVDMALEELDTKRYTEFFNQLV